MFFVNEECLFIYNSSCQRELKHYNKTSSTRRIFDSMNQDFWRPEAVVFMNMYE